MQTLQQQQQQARSNAQHYDESCEYMGMMEAGSFDEEVVEEGVRWQGLCRDDNGMLQVYAEYTWDAGADSGTGWWL
jgi:hypothetical protein